MENSSKALYMAGSLLIALLIISVLVYAYNNIGVLQSGKDQVEFEKSISDFNKEYEAFDKKIMYGVDVISCINKAINNDEKYIKGGKWSQGTGASSQEEAFVNVIVELKTDCLSEKLEVTQYNKKRNKFSLITSFKQDTSGSGNWLGGNREWDDIINSLDSSTQKTINNLKFSALKGAGSIKLADLLVEQNGTVGSRNHFDITIPKTFQLLEDKKSGKEFEDSQFSLYSLVKYCTEQSISFDNPKKDEINSETEWASIKWITSISDFKKRKFGCDNSRMKYDENTGRITQIVFVEK